MKLLLFTAATAVVWTVASSLPQCDEDCSSGFCKSECYEGSENLLCSCEIRKPGGNPECKDSTDTECTGVTEDIDNDSCAAACTASDECQAYIFDGNLFGPRCRLLTECLSMEDAAVTQPCSDCEPSRKCAFCPKLEYSAGQTSIHWICESSVDPYENVMPDGSFCKPSHNCEAAPIPANITCSSDGQWKDDKGETITDVPSLDQACPCSDLIIPNSVDTNLFCSGGQPELETNDGKEFWTLNGDFPNCDLVCDGSVFIPVQCTFGEGDSGTTSWSITYGGVPSELDKDCFACSFSACDAFTTEEPGPGTSPTTPGTSPTTPGTSPTTPGTAPGTSSTAEM